ncbi:MAG: sulfatase [Kordiimonadaceae bacterium]|nr:sulfatase [Kordiimonadaceae bacterium]
MQNNGTFDPLKHARIGILILAGIMMQTGLSASPVSPQDAGTSKQTETRPNIVLIVADDHGTDAIGAYGNPIIATPSLDQLAQKGVRFTEAHATVSSCSPSRSVLLTGLQNHTNGMYGLEHWEHHFSSLENTPSLPILLSEAGYKTGRIGKYHIGPKNVYQFDKVLSRGAANDMASIARSPVEMAENSKSFIEEGDKPFFLYYASDDPHRGFPFDTYPAPNKFGNRTGGYPGIKPKTYTPEDVIVPSFLPDSPSVRQELAEYYQAVSRLDQGVGRLMEILEETGKLENTIIIYLSDNGVAFPMAKTNLYQPGIQLPLIIQDPRAKAEGWVSDMLVSWTDITPTILQYAHVAYDPEAFHGQSIMGHVRTQKPLERTAIFGSHSFHEVQMYYPVRMIRTDRFKLLYNIAHPLDYPFALDLLQSSSWQSFVNDEAGEQVFGKRSLKAFSKRPEYELYDLDADPNEITNLADNPDYAAVLEQLKGQLHTFMKDTKDPWRSKLLYE